MAEPEHAVCWFGDAALGDPQHRVDTPIGAECMACPEAIKREDGGYALAFLSPRAPESMPYVYYHADCFRRATGFPTR